MIKRQINLIRVNFITLISLLTIISVIYSNTLNSEFHFDDLPNIVDSRDIHINTLSNSSLKDAAFNKIAIRRPVTNITFALNYYFGELDVFGYHLVNIIIHIITAIAIYLFLYNTINIGVQGAGGRGQGNFQITGFRDRSFWIAFIATLLWATSPVQTQAVTYIVQRATSMATMFYMLSLLCYVKGRIILEARSQEPVARSKGRLDGLLASGFWLLASLFFAFLAFGTKEISATLPLVIILYEIYFFARFDSKAIRRISLYPGIMVVLFIIVGFLYLSAGKEGGIIEGITALIKERDIEGKGFTAIERLITEFRIVIYYITLLILPLPSRLRVLYDFPVSRSLFEPMSTFVCLGLIIAIIGYGMCVWRKRPLISFFILWFFINMVIESSIIRLWLVFEHRLYLPSIGFFVIIAIGIVKLMDMVKSRGKSSTHNYLLLTICSLLIAFVLIQSIWTYQRNLVWRNGLTLWSDNLKKAPMLGIVHNNLGALYTEKGDEERAIALLKKAIELDPLHIDAYNNLGVIYERQEKFELAIRHYEHSLKIDSYNITAHNNLGVIYKKLGRYESAALELKKIIRLDPYNADAVNNLGSLYIDMGKREEAFEYFKKAIEFDPQNMMAHNNLGLIYMDKGLQDKAIEEFLEVLKIDKDSYEASLKLGILYQEKGDINNAIKYLKRSNRISPVNFEPNYYMGATYHSIGEFKLAERYYKNALEIRPETPFIYFNLGLVYSEKGRWEMAEKSYRNALRLDPDLKSAEVNLKNVLRQNMKKGR